MGSNLTGGWTDENVARLKELWATGASCSQIAAALDCGVSRNAVIGKATRLGLSPRKTLTVARPRAHMRRNRRSNAAQAIAGVRRAQRWQSIEPEPLPEEPEEIVIPVAQRRSLMQLNEHTCRWPVGDPGEGDFFFCGAEPAVDQSYCPAHCRIAHRPTPDGHGRRVLREYRV